MNPTTKVVIANMHTKSAMQWVPVKNNIRNKRLRRSVSVLAAVCLCIGAGAIAGNWPKGVAVNRIQADFDYDDTLGRLRFVSNILPESAMVFLSSNYSTEITLAPSEEAISHSWTEDEPWIEYDAMSDITACQDGQIMTVVKNRENEYTIRVMHDHGYESIYSGLRDVQLKTADAVTAGQMLGIASGHAAFELRKDGLSVLPVFAD